MSIRRSAATVPTLGVLAIAVVAIIAVAAMYRAGQAEAVETRQQLLTFTGTGSAQVAPDKATLQVGVRTSGTSADEALDAASEKMRVVIRRIKDQGLDDEQLQTSDVSTYEDHEREGRFWASQSLTITLDEPERAGTLLGEATDAGADTVHGPAFGLEDQRAGYDEALRQAIADARAKAEAAASHIDADVGAVVSINEPDHVGGPGPMTTAAAADARTEEVPIEEGTQTVTMTVEVSFSHRPR